MLLLSLGSETIAALLCTGEGGRRDGPLAQSMSGPDLAWLLFGPDMRPEAQDTGSVIRETVGLYRGG